jgi:hypothetical protein
VKTRFQNLPLKFNLQRYIKAVQLGAAMAARNVFTSDTLYAEHNMPKEMALSSKGDAVFDMVHVGNTPPPGLPGGPAPPPPVPERFQSAFTGGDYDGPGDGGEAAAAALDALRPVGNGAPGGSAIDDMIAAGMTAVPAAAAGKSRAATASGAAMSRPKTAPPGGREQQQQPIISKAERAHHATFDASVEEAAAGPASARGSSRFRSAASAAAAVSKSPLKVGLYKLAQHTYTCHVYP